MSVQRHTNMSQMLIKILNAKGYEKDSGEPLNCYWDG